MEDYHGHATHVAGTIGGNGYLSNGEYIGVAPEVNLIAVKISNDKGESRTSDVVAGLEWILANKDVYNIRVVNLSLSLWGESTVSKSNSTTVQQIRFSSPTTPTTRTSSDPLVMTKRRRRSDTCSRFTNRGRR